MSVIKYKDAYIINQHKGSLAAKLTGTPDNSSMPYVFSGTIKSMKMDKDGIIVEFKTDEATYKRVQHIELVATFEPEQQA